MIRLRQSMFKYVPADTTPVKIPRHITPIQSPRMSDDPRSILAYSLFNSMDHGNILLYGTPRSGRTSSLIAESLNRGETFLALEPTKAISEDTIKDAVALNDNGISCDGIIPIMSNRDGCMLIKKHIEENEYLEKLPMIPLPKACEDEGHKTCEHYEECPYTKILRTDIKDIKGITATQHKIIASMLSNNIVSGDIKEKISRCVKNVIIDECHRLESPMVKNVSIIKRTQTARYDTKFEIPSSISEYENICKVVEILNRLKEYPEFKKAIEDMYNTTNNKKPKTKEERKEYEKITNTKLCNPFYMPECINDTISGVYAEMVKMADAVKAENVDFETFVFYINNIYNIAAIALSEEINVNRATIHGIEHIRLSAIDHASYNAIKDFLYNMEGERRLIFTSGTINNDFEYDTLINNHGKETPVINKVIWGERGDPLDTCAKMHIYTDGIKCTMYGNSKNSFGRDEVLNNIVDDIKRIQKLVPDAIIATMNKELSGSLSKKLGQSVIYFNSIESIGVKCDKRAMIVVGMAYKPTDAFDTSTNTRTESFETMHKTMHADTYQTMSRVKDPDGKEDSFVFMLRCNEDDVRNCATYGVNRFVRAVENGRGRRIDVLVRADKIALPIISKCKDAEEMVYKARNTISFNNTKNNNLAVC